VVNAVTERGKWPLIIFIDDLDRCSPQKSAETIEAINLFLDAEHCVFILGMDSRTVARSIEAKYQEVLPQLAGSYSESRISLGQRFLEKIIQITFRIPPPDDEKIDKFVDEILDLHETSEEEAEVDDIERAVVKEGIQANQRLGLPLEQATKTFKSENPNVDDTVIEDAKKHLQEEAFDESGEVKWAVKEAAGYLNNNPRKIKRYINLFRLQVLIAKQRGLLADETVKLQILAKWLIIATLWPGVILIIKDDQEFVSKLRAARKSQEEYNKCLLSTSESDGSVSEEDLHSQLRQLEQLEKRLAHNLSDADVKRFYADDDLMQLLNDVPRDFKDLTSYLQLAQITVNYSIPF
jgi:hypothetical protein